MPNDQKRRLTVMNIKERDLDFWIANNYNVLLEGRHGVGKTHKVIDAFNRNGLKWRYFSASTMDPWTDFVGVPKERTNEDGSSYLDFVLPKDFADDSIEALFFDEFNRAPKKVRNAVMELIQFKSINGRKFPNLKIVWAAINPEDDDDLEFDVDPIDPAQLDRFQVQVSIPYKADLAYFQSKYGNDCGKAAVDWWEGLNSDQQLDISPRRLDYAVQMFRDGGHIKYVLPGVNVPISKLNDALSFGPPEETIRSFMKSNNVDQARRWLAHDNNREGIKSLIVDDADVRKFVLPLLQAEHIAGLISSNKAIRDEVSQNPHEYREVIEDLVAGAQNAKVKKKFTAILATLNQMEHSSGEGIEFVFVNQSKALPQHFRKSEQEHMRKNFRFKESFDVIDDPFAGDDLESEIIEIAGQTMGATNSFFKDQLMSRLETVACSDLNDAQGIAVARICNFMASTCSIEKLNSYEKLPLVFNTAINAILEGRPDYTVEDLFKIAPYFFYKYFSKLNNTLPTNAKDLAIGPKPKSEWTETADEELEKTVI